MAFPRRSRNPISFAGVDGAMKVKDPVCGMTIEQSKAAAQGTYGSETIYFCSAMCKQTYDRTHSPTTA